MSKESKTVKMDPEAKAILDSQSKTDEDKARDAIESLKTNLESFRERSRYFSQMVLKAEGALEVLMQLHPEKESDEG
tara:strand:+ start:2403 stop:2633 length:231 start_codon:yes stop_codon:yes gene_type:complete